MSVAQIFEERIDPDLQSRGIFHGYVPLTDVKTLLIKEGDYLLRLIEHYGQLVCVLSVYHNGEVITVCVNRKDQMYFFNVDYKVRMEHLSIRNVQHSSVGSLLDWHRNTKTPLAEKQIILENPVAFASWNLPSSSIAQLLGDIYGCYRMKSYEVIIYVEKQKIHAAALLLTNKQLMVESKKQFLAEARILKELSHPNILQFYGVIVTAVPLTMIVGLCKTNLLILLKKRKLRKDQKLRYVTEAAAALKYFTEKGYVHKTKNCLIDQNMTLKLANFCYAASDRCPPFIHQESLDNICTRWLAPETMLRHDFSKETDVWAFGVLNITSSFKMWEIYENGETPYRDLSNMEIRSYIIRSKKRLELPKKAPIKVKKSMARCWEEKPSRRPTFQELETTLKGIKNKEL
uniref:Protein kinase domain-containing protein n=1 Tax=Setaria digitata TaxID=48799 RepID=A0A915PL02_9BILA